WGGPEYPGQGLVHDIVYANAGVPLVASTGDYSYGPENPSNYTEVTAAGGTRLEVKHNTNYPTLTALGEKGWADAGGGYSGSGVNQLMKDFCFIAGIPNNSCSETNLCTAYLGTTVNCHEQLGMVVAASTAEANFADIHNFWYPKLGITPGQ